jgi:CheY-like chemotaxis protein
MVPSTIGELLRRSGMIDDDQLSAAFAHRQANGGKLGEAFVALGFVTENEMLEALSRDLGVPVLSEAEVIELNISAEVRASIPRFLVEEELVFPIAVDAERASLTVVTHEPPDDPTLDGLRIFANVETIKISLTTKSAMRKLLARHMPPDVDAVAAARAAASDRGEHAPSAEGASVAAAAKPPEVRSPGSTIDDLVNTERISLSHSDVSTGWDEETPASGSRVLPFRDPVEEIPPAERPPAAVAPAGVAPEPIRIEDPDEEPPAAPAPSPAASPALVDAPFLGAETPPSVDAARQFQFFFDLWDLALRLLAAPAPSERRRARARAELARDVASELELPRKDQEEIYLGTYLCDLDGLLEHAGFSEDGHNPTEALLLRAQCPYDLREFLGGALAARSLRDTPATLRQRIAWVAAAYIENAPASGMGVRDTLQRIPWAYDVPDLAVALLRALARRGELLLPEPAKGTEVIVVDPDTHAGGVLGLRFMADGAPVRVFADGAAAFCHLRDRGAALVISEVRLPGISGLDLCQAVKDDPGISPVSFFFLSAEADPTVISKALETGAEDYFVKPVNVELLLVKAKRAITRPEN